MDLSLASLVTVSGVAVVVLVLTQLVKDKLPAADVPRAAVLMGIVVALGATWALGKVAGMELGQAVVNGLLGGAAAVGIYEAQKPSQILPGKS